MKKLFALILIFSLLLSCCSCAIFGGDIGAYPEDEFFEEEVESDESSAAVSSAEPKKSTVVKHSSKTSAGDVIVTVKEQQANEKAEKEATSPAISKTVAKYSTAVKTEQYYQYCSLSASQKKAYNTVCRSIEKTDNVINIDQYALNLDQAKQMLIRLIADNPQYFWVSKQNKITYTSGSKKVYSIILYYSDGLVEDELDGNFKLTKTASRSAIDSQIVQYNSAVQTVMKSCYKSDKLLSEKAIHDYIIKTVRYNDAVAAQDNYEGVLPHDFDAFGALCKKSAVCEGYVKAFQFLCLQSGINCTQIISGGDGGHMWAAVCLDGAWYQVDVTWDDMDDKGIAPYYNYFNVTDSQMSADHKTDYTRLAVPKCTATKANYYDNFSLLVPNEHGAVQNVQKAIDNFVKTDDVYITLKFSQKPKSLTNYVRRYEYSSDSVITEYINKMGYKLTLTSDISYYMNDCYYIRVTRG